MSTKRIPFELPRLKAQDELLKNAPELLKYFQTPQLPASPAAAKSSTASNQNVNNNNSSSSSTGSPTSPTALAAAASKHRTHTQHLESDDEEAQERELRAEMAKAKKERATLMTSLQSMRDAHGKAGGDLQLADIEALRQDIAIRQEKLNELRSCNIKIQEIVDTLKVENRDCELMCLIEDPVIAQRITTLKSQLAAAEQETAEQDRKCEQYTLLRNRTRQDKDTAELSQRSMKQLSDAMEEDVHALTRYMHEMRAAKEDTERELGAVVALFDQVKLNWQRKLKDKMKEVQDVERRKMAEETVRAREAAKAEEIAKVQRAKAEAARVEQERKAEVRYSSVLPQLDALEASWSRLLGATGGNRTDTITTCWKELREKTATLRALLQLAEAREARTNEDLAALKVQRDQALTSNTDTAAMTTSSSLSSSLSSSNPIPTSPVDIMVAKETAIVKELAAVEAHRADVAKKLARLNKLCTGIEQSLQLTLNRATAVKAITAGNPSKQGSKGAKGDSSQTQRGSIAKVSQPGGAKAPIVKRMSAAVLQSVRSKASRPSTIPISKVMAPSSAAVSSSTTNVDLQQQQMSESNAPTNVDISAAPPANNVTASTTTATGGADTQADTIAQDVRFFPQLPNLIDQTRQQIEQLNALTQRLLSAPSTDGKTSGGGNIMGRRRSSTTNATTPGSNGKSKNRSSSSAATRNSVADAAAAIAAPTSAVDTVTPSPGAGSSLASNAATGGSWDTLLRQDSMQSVSTTASSASSTTTKPKSSLKPSATMVTPASSSVVATAQQQQKDHHLDEQKDNQEGQQRRVSTHSTTSKDSRDSRRSSVRFVELPSTEQTIEQPPTTTTTATTDASSSTGTTVVNTTNAALPAGSQRFPRSTLTRPVLLDSIAQVTKQGQHPAAFAEMKNELSRKLSGTAATFAAVAQQLDTTAPDPVAAAVSPTTSADIATTSPTAVPVPIPSAVMPVPELERLAGYVTAPRQHVDNDPFALESSDDDDASVMDRAAVKHRSNKILNPKKPKKRV